jgi:DNA-binding NarL/FixJ family response regulator
MPSSRGDGGQGIHVLVVEDLAMVREFVAEAFDREPGFSVRQAGGLAEAREQLERVDVAVLDLHLPDGDGTELIPELKAANPQATALILTASMDPAEIRHARECGAAAVLNKLDELGDVLETVKRLDPRTRTC